MACLVGYEKDNFLLIYLADKYNNMLYGLFKNKKQLVYFQGVS